MIRMLLDRFLIFSKSLVSKFIHIIASNEVKGIEAKIPAMIVERLDISETATTINAVINILKIIYIKILNN